MHPTEPTDAALVEKCLNGKKDVFQELVKRHQHRIYYMALTRMKDRFEADDLAQETFVRAYRKLALFDPRYSFRNWLMSICVNLSKNRFRTQVRRREVHNPNIEIKDGTSQDQDTSRIDLMAALHEIPETLRVPLVLKHVEGFSYDEIAGMMKIGTSAAKMRVQRGRDQLVRSLKLET